MKRIPFIIGVIMGLACMAAAGIGLFAGGTSAASLDTGVRGERADYREAVIAFGRENAALLDEAVAAVLTYDPPPREARMDHGLFFGDDLIADFGRGEYDRMRNDALEALFRGTLLNGVEAFDGGWAFDTDFNPAVMLDLLRNYRILYRTADPLAGDGWTSFGGGWTRSEPTDGGETVHYVERIADGLYYSYTGWY